MRRLNVATHHVIHVSEFPAPGSGWRGWLGGKLRDLATRVDGDRSPRLRIVTWPELPRAVTARCLETGVDHAALLIREACRAQAIENAMRVACPKLYADEAATREDAK